MIRHTDIPGHVEEALERDADKPGTSRRDFIRNTGLFVVSFSAASVLEPALAAAAQAPARGAGPYPDPDFLQLDSWIAIRPDNTAVFSVGKTDLGQGTGTAFRQIMADELDLPYASTTCVMGTTNLTVDQGGSGGSDALQTDGYPMRRVAAEARRVLLDMASAQLGVPVAELTVSNAVVSSRTDPSKKVTYGQLIGGKRFNVTLTRRQHRRDDGRRQDQGRAGPEDRRHLAAALRHSRKGGRLGEVGRGRQAPGHGARAQRPAALRRREAGQRGRIVRPRHSRLREGGHQRQLRRRRLRARRTGDQGRSTTESHLAAAGIVAIPGVRGSVQVHAQRDADVQRARPSPLATRPRRWRAPPRSSRPNTTCRSRDTRPSVLRTRWPIRQTIS